ncbi:UDP-glucose 4-epimerase [Parafrankia irregularis]|uniref:UDP-glucose 4-epimerase n=1 Tax=Parafrankia irregularis TaxID=795642 RepID=A0A0S4QQ88_9ACTN|nr:MULTISPECIES: NAD-dependent epimerase/dehydratase family protein [Parafrankia]MBE3202681.1 NAD-dependent epimerase/dehydratase family protein [Parafrankia sp. CH37]CUU57867.1 UDP-glucose 4-epimerase [Parafrankia irregularis]
MRILVTGASGFVGGVTADLLCAAGHQVTALVRDATARSRLSRMVEVVQADLLEPRQLAAAGVSRGFDGVCHLAALTRVRESRETPLRYFAANVTGTINLLAALDAGTRATGVAPRFVFGSSCAVYGDGGTSPIPETRAAAPTSPYGASKLAAEQAVAYQAATGRLGAIVLRSFNVAGAVGSHSDRDSSRIIPAALGVASGRRDAFRVNGDGASIREYVHVVDMARAYLTALRAVVPGQCTVYNVGSGVGVSVSDVLATVESVTGRDVPRVTLPAVPEPRALIADSTRIRADLGWNSPSSTIERIVADAWRSTAVLESVPVGRADVPIGT